MSILSDINSVLKAAGILSTSLLAGLVLDKVVLRRLKILARRTPWEGDEIPFPIRTIHITQNATPEEGT